MTQKPTRRQFIKAAATTATAGIAVPYILKNPRAIASYQANERRVIGCIGTGERWGLIVGGARRYGDVAAVCDVDAERAESAKERTGGQATVHNDYRELLDNQDIDVVLIATPDHWHAKCSIDAMKAGNDDYCEKPLSLTIDEGKKICQVTRETGRVFQVGTQQRSEFRLMFITAVALCRAGRLGEVQSASCAIAGARAGGPFAATDPPAQLDWEKWLGQSPLVDYRQQRCHYNFRWWYEYSGGKLTDWGAHYVDIAQWVLDKDDTGPISVEGTAEFPMPLENGYPTLDDRYNTATAFTISARYDDGKEIKVMQRDEDKGVLIEGDRGRIVVNRGRLVGRPVEELVDNPLPEGLIQELYKGKEPGGHMRNFFECIADRSDPISDVYSHHRAITICHLANITTRLGRPLQWDPESEQIVGDDEANTFLAREQRAGYEVTV